MALSWNEIKERATKFSTTWKDACNEDSEAKEFLVGFFNIFGREERVGTFEKRVKKLDTADGYIDYFWKGNILVEMKSRGKDLDKAYKQAMDYLHGVPDHELPQVVMVSDFDKFIVYHLNDEKKSEFRIHELVSNVEMFGFLAGYQKKIYKEQDPVNIKAAEHMGKLHDSLKAIGYVGHDLEVYLVRLLFCLFAEDTGIFNKQQFQDYIEERTHCDGSDLAGRLQELFQVLNTDNDKRFKNIDIQLGAFPYINGKLFEEMLPTASFDSKMRTALLECCYIDWSKISPAIFGSMFQSVMNPVERRNLGAHYTSEKNIMKLIKPLFLDDLWKEFETVKNNEKKLEAFHIKLSTLKFLDPACGCGNFLIISYRELRFLELEVIRNLNKEGQRFFNIKDMILLTIDHFFGIEYEEFPARIAGVAMWLMDHQMNMLVSQEFGEYVCNIPLKKSATIVNGNALQIDWETVVPKNELSYILGNPPFIGKQLQNEQQKADMELVFGKSSGTGVLDYVTAWYIKAARYIQNSTIQCAFVSTNSISQGEQVGILWDILFKQFTIKIHFAHRTFKWGNEAKGNAAVHVVIIGFANFDRAEKYIYEYEDIKGEPHEIKVKNINPYLVEGSDFALNTVRKPICNVPEILFGSKLVDDGNFLFTEEEKIDFIDKEPTSNKFFRLILSGDEFLNGKKRWCLWLKNISPSELRESKLVTERVKKVKEFRLKSTKIPTQKAANFPTLFAELRQPESDFLLVPLTSSENRNYIPLGFFSKNYIVTNSCSVIANATIFHFGILTSLMHMSWVRNTCGRLKSDFRYSNTIVYNNFPWPENPSDDKKNAVETAAQKVLDVRLKYPDSSLADLYDPNTMPADLVKAHNELDKAVDGCYRKEPFKSEAARMEFLFELYEKYVGK
ncbi:MAG: methylase [Spirochaetes bacterium RIFOXYB1_FULL_32_8]|nr:MAG: methylase [Spirochaetes bacterium GWE1_32_154]OHD50487.1 MAG: methylase [Spirochaetes bacterium GWE2_31_10]OHD82290.1 MAG: methylase [Spirochaetes bacterium RIFOXYB1_FULL_32_8]HBD93247.1 SAM-dependent methyltransferase [Spirochaetia bacterium]HBI38379.1 SAM-dependent methyltransferase [Spirochaetia bacterium]